MADRWHDSHLHNRLGQTPQTPIGEAFWRRSQPRGDDLRFLLAVQQLGPWWLLARLPVEGNLEPQRHEPFANILDRLGTTADRLGNLGVGPRRTVRVRFQKDL